MFFAGKGGVGKTTCAAARAVHSAISGQRVLVISTDPAHSLGDALGVRLSSRVATVALQRGRVLHAVELDGSRAFARWMSEHRQAMSDIIEHGTWLDRDDVEGLLGLPVPGVDELVGLLEIVRLAGARSSPTATYDLVIVDTAPTGHTLRLLAAPATVGVVAAALDDLQEEHRLIREQLARVRSPEASDRLIALLAEQADQTGQLLRTSRRSTFAWVLLPEALSIEESRDGLLALDAAGIRVAEVIVNRVVPRGSQSTTDLRSCAMCDRRRRDEQWVLTEIRRTIAKGRTMRIIPAVTREPRGVRALKAFGEQLTAPLGAAPRRVGRVVPPTHPIFSGAVGPNGGSDRPVLRLSRFPESLRLMFVGGKGGAGKTTVAAALALQVTRAHPERRVLLLSTDPAHSLADVFKTSVGDTPAPVRAAPANLHVRELDAAAALASRRAGLEAAVNGMIDAVGAASLSLSSGRGLSQLMDLAPPGIDELFGLLSVAENLTLEQGRRGSQYDQVIVDTAPTGHALRLIEMPDVARDWVRLLMRLLLKYRDVARPGQLAGNLIELSRSIRTLEGFLRDPSLAHFIVVTRAAEVPRLETERLIKRLGRFNLGVPTVIANALTLAPGGCAKCRATAAAEKKELGFLTKACRRLSHECAIIQTPLAAPAPRGVAALDAWARTWIEEPTSIA